MKKIIFSIIFGIFLCVGTLIHAETTWQTANQFTIAWDAVTTNTNGEALNETDIIKYEVLIANNLTDPDKLNPVSLGITDQATYTLTLNTEGQYIIGVKSLRYIVENDVEVLVASSTISWSDDPNVGTEFGVRYFLPPAAVGGIHSGI